MVLYGAEMWSLTKIVRERIRMVGLDYMRRGWRKTRRDRIRKDEIWRQMKKSYFITGTLEHRAIQ